MHAKQCKFIICFMILSVSVSACSPQEITAIPTFGATPTPRLVPSDTPQPTLPSSETVAVPGTSKSTFEGHWTADFHLVINTSTQETDVQGSQVLFYLEQQGDRVSGSIIGREPFGELSGSVDEAGVFRGTLQWEDGVDWESLTMRFSTDGTSLVGTAVRQASPDEWEFYIIDLQPSPY